MDGSPFIVSTNPRVRDKHALTADSCEISEESTLVGDLSELFIAMGREKI